MKIQFDNVQPSVLEHLNGGQGQLVSRRHMDGNVKITRALLAPGCSIGMHTHATSSEVIFVLSGVGKMLIDDTEEILRPGVCHYCPQGHSHSFINEGDQDLVFYAVVPEHRD